MPGRPNKITTQRKKSDNIRKAWELLQKGQSQGWSLAVLGEMFNSPYQLDLFHSYAENEKNCLESVHKLSLEEILSDSKAPTIDFLKWASQSLEMTIVGGSIAYLEEDQKLYNTCLIASKGQITGKYSKMHLFDIDIPGRISFKESSVLSLGNSFFTFEHEGFRFGVGICYDVRFIRHALTLRDLGCEVLIYPSVFNNTTGPLHFELLARARATDTQSYVMMGSNAPNKEDETIFQSWGHSMVVDPYGVKRGDLEFEEGILEIELDGSLVEEVRNGIPTSFQQRRDLYNC